MYYAGTCTIKESNMKSLIKSKQYCKSLCTLKNIYLSMHCLPFEMILNKCCCEHEWSERSKTVFNFSNNNFIKKMLKTTSRYRYKVNQ